MRVSPRMLSSVAVLAAAAMAAVLAVSAASGATRALRTTRASRSERSLGSLNHEVLAAINAFREAHGLHTLRLSAALDRSASEHSFEMGADGYFAHPSADGEAFWRRIEHYYGSSRSNYWSVGENLLWASPGIDAEHAMQLWINSPEHLANLMAARWRQIGVSSVHVLHAPGTYGGLDVTIITTDFGVRH